MAEPARLDRPLSKPADLRRAVSEWAGLGFVVKIAPDGAITVEPPGERQPDAALIDWSRK